MIPTFYEHSRPKCWCLFKEYDLIMHKNAPIDLWCSKVGNQWSYEGYRCRFHKKNEPREKHSGYTLLLTMPPPTTCTEETLYIMYICVCEKALEITLRKSITFFLSFHFFLSLFLTHIFLDFLFVMFFLLILSFSLTYIGDNNRM
jgi:hypothetical protein